MALLLGTRGTRANESKPVAGFFNPLLCGLMRSDASIPRDLVRRRRGEFGTVKGYDLVTRLRSRNGQTLIDVPVGD